MEAAPVYAEPGWLLYARQGVLAAVPFDAGAMKITGNPVMLEDEPASILDPATSFTAGRSVSVSRAGSLAYYSAPSLNTVATWYDASGAQMGALNVPAGHYETLTISPDGTRGVLVRSTSPSESSLWLVDMVRGGATALSSGAGRNDSPVWSPDGSRVVWAADRDGTQKFYVKNVNDGSAEQMLFGSEAPFKNPSAWSPDGQSITFTQLDPAAAQNIYLLNVTAAKDPTVLVHSRTRDIGGPVSPDGRWMAYFSDENGRIQLYVQSFPKPARRMQISDDGAVIAWWTRDGRQLYFLGDDFRRLWRVDVQLDTAVVVGTPRQIATLPEEIVWMAAMPDRQRFVAIAPERTGTGSITVVQNWRAALTAVR
jgi:WD40 repeat protein